MVKFHTINKVITAGTILYFISLAIIIIGDIFNKDKTVLAFAFSYGLILFGISVITLFIGLILGIRSGKVQKWFDERSGKTGRNENFDFSIKVD